MDEIKAHLTKNKLNDSEGVQKSTKWLQVTYHSMFLFFALPNLWLRINSMIILMHSHFKIEVYFAYSSHQLNSRNWDELKCNHCALRREILNFNLINYSHLSTASHSLWKPAWVITRSEMKHFQRVINV